MTQQAVTQYDNVPVHTGQQIHPAKKAPPMSIGMALEKAIPHLKMALPKTMDPERMARIALTTIRRSPELQRCEVNSLAGAILESASLGLEIDSRGLAYLVPYKSNATLIVGYKGLMQLAYRSGKLNNIYADVVYKNEVEAGNVSIELGADRSLRHTFDILSSSPLRKESADNPIVLAYAVAVFKDNSKHFEFVTEAEVQKRKGVSPAAAKGFLWTKWIDEAWKKTAIRKLCKYMDLSPEIQRAVVLDEQADAEQGKQRYDFAATIDVDFSSNGDPQTAKEEDQPSEQKKNPTPPKRRTTPAKESPAPDARQPAPAEQAAPSQQKPAPEMDQKTGEVFDDPFEGGTFGTPPVGMMYPVYCRHSEKWVEETACEKCSMLPGCPSWAQSDEDNTDDDA